MLNLNLKPEQKKKVLSVNFVEQCIYLTPHKTFFPIISVNVKFMKTLITLGKMYNLTDPCCY